MNLKNLSRLDQDKAIANWLESHLDANNQIREILNDLPKLSAYVTEWLIYGDYDPTVYLFEEIRSALIDIIESEDLHEGITIKNCYFRYEKTPYTGSPLDVIKKHAEDVKK